MSMPERSDRRLRRPSARGSPMMLSKTRTLPGADSSAIACRSHEIFVRHPWLPLVASYRPHLGENAVRHAEQLLEALAELGLPSGDAWHILHAVNDLTLGHAIRITHAGQGHADEFPALDGDQFPRPAAALTARTTPRDDTTFRAALDLLLDGVDLRNVRRSVASKTD
jgi:hypothetical protein